MKDSGDNFVKAALDSLEQDTDVEWRPRVPQWPAIGETMATAIQSALVGQKKPKEALDEAQSRIQQFLKADWPRACACSGGGAPHTGGPGAALRAGAARRRRCSCCC